MGRSIRVDPEVLAKLAAEGRVTERGVNLAALIDAPGRVANVGNTAPPEKEALFQERVLALAHARGWLVAHFRPVREVGKGGKVYYRTPVAADGAGFPDLELVRDRLVKAELKSDRRRRKTKAKDPLTPDQVKWRDAYVKAGVEWYCWEPADWDQIVEVLR